MKTIQTDYHMHTIFSSDGENTPVTMCRRALELGITEIAFTEHAEWFNGGNGFPRADDYFAALAACRDQFEPEGLTLLSGVELGNPHWFLEETAVLLNRYTFDVKIASLHWLYQQNIHLAACFAGREPYQVYADYFTELGRMAARVDVDIIAHFDRILWRGTALHGPFDPLRVREQIEAALGIIAERGLLLELNSRLIAAPDNWNDALVTMLGWFRAAGGHGVVINSDAHRAAQLGANQELALQLLQAAGFAAPARLSVFAI